jgi:tetratricopeptide (TPR) repeat protein
LLRTGQFKEAELELRRVVEVIGPDPFVLLDLGIALRAQNRLPDAIAIFKGCVQALPNLALPQVELAAALQAAGRPEEALPHYRTALQTTSNDPSLRIQYAQCLFSTGATNTGLEEMKLTSQACPTNSALRILLAEALAACDRHPEAIAQYREALRLDPQSLVAGNNLAWIMATHPDAALRDGPTATHLAEAACTATQRRVAVFLGTLAAAYAESGRFSEAVKTAEEAAAIATAKGETEVANRNEVLKRMYEDRRAYRESPPPTAPAK